jgi:hypothetical protein
LKQHLGNGTLPYFTEKYDVTSTGLSPRLKSLYGVLTAIPTLLHCLFFSAHTTGPPVDGKQRVLIVFVGGMTYGEASCVRWLGQVCNKEMVMLTTDTLTGNDAAAAFDARASQQA